MQFIPDWYVKFVKVVFLAFGLVVVGKLVGSRTREAQDRKEQRR